MPPGIRSGTADRRSSRSSNLTLCAITRSLHALCMRLCALLHPSRVLDLAGHARGDRSPDLRRQFGNQPVPAPRQRIRLPRRQLVRLHVPGPRPDVKAAQLVLPFPVPRLSRRQLLQIGNLLGLICPHQLPEGVAALARRSRPLPPQRRRRRERRVQPFDAGTGSQPVERDPRRFGLRDQRLGRGPSGGVVGPVPDRRDPVVPPPGFPEPLPEAFRRNRPEPDARGRRVASRRVPQRLRPRRPSTGTGKVAVRAGQPRGAWPFNGTLLTRCF